MDFSQDQQGRLVSVRTAVAATCIKIYSQVTQRNLIACSVHLSVISFGIVFTIQPVSSNHLKRKAAYTGTEVKMFYTRYTDINGMHVI